MSASPTTSGQDDHLVEMIESATALVRRDVPLDFDAHQRFFKRRGEFNEGFVALVRRLSAKLPDYTLAKKILKGDFVTPEEIMAKRLVVYTDEQIQTLADQLPSEEDLRWLKKNGFALMAAPPTAMALLDVRSLKADHFYSKTGGWYADGQKFAHDDKTSFGWLMIRKTAVPNSTNKTWGEQTPLLSNVEHVPNAAEMSWFITTFYEVRGIRLFESVYVRTSSVGSDGDRVRVGNFDARGLVVDSYWGADRHSGLGVSSARQSFLYLTEIPRGAGFLLHLFD